MSRDEKRTIEKELINERLEEIERNLIENEYSSAFEHLIDFARDFASSYRNDAVQLYAQYNRWKRDSRRGLLPPDHVNSIVAQVLELKEQVAREAHFRPELQLPELIKVPAAPNVKGRIVAKALPDEENAKLEEAIRKIEVAEVRRTKGQRSVQELQADYLNVWRQTQPSRQKVTAFRSEGVVKSFSRGGFTLGPVSFELLDGEITGIVGMNASGKTTLLRVVLGDLKPREGQVSYPALSKDPNDWIGIKNQIAFISQFTERWHGKLRNNLTFAAAVYGTTGKENDELVDWYLQRYGLVDYEDATWEVISGGYRTRFDLVRALLSQPRLLVLDEPLAYLDIVTQQVFLSDLRTIASSLQRPIPVIITSQHLYEIEAIADQLIILDNGKCLFSGYVDQISRDFEHKIYEITVKARKLELIEALNPIGLEDIEATMTGHILTFPKESASKVIFDTLSEAFGERLIYFRNITRSTRSLFRNRRDDIIKED